MSTSNPPEAWNPLVRAVRLAARPIERFLRIEAASGIVLLVAAAVALVLANSPWAASVAHFWHTPIAVRFGDWTFERSLEWLVNDGLMVVFFFVVGLEIRRELAHGELSEVKRAALPVVAALGGMLVPAAIYLAIAGAEGTRSGWGVPMATDIAFAVGILTLLGKRVPPALRVLLLALAIIDDLGAIIVIALFYSHAFAFSGLLIAAGGIAAVLLLRWLGVRAKLVYVLPGVVVWAGILSAGIHPTIAGVILGLLTPVDAWLGRAGLVEGLHQQLDLLEAAPEKELGAHELNERLAQLSHVRREAQSPAESLIEMLHPYVAFGIMPLFALANAGVSLSEISLQGAPGKVAIGATLGLVLGKPIGVILACVITLRLGWAKLPTGLGFKHLYVLGAVAGVGFTMALFIAQLAFAEAALLGAAKSGVLIASGVASVAALLLGRALLHPQLPEGAAESHDAAENSTAQ